MPVVAVQSREHLASTSRPKTTPWHTGHPLNVSPPLCITTSINIAHKKKNTLDMTPLGMEAWQESLVGFIYILLFFFLYYRWYLLLQLSQWQRLPFHSPVPSSSPFGLWKAVMAKIGPNDARCVVWAFSKLFYFYFYFFFHVQLTLTIIFR